MAWADLVRYFRKPSRVLGFLLSAVLICTALLACWQSTGLLLFRFPITPPPILAGQWPVILAAVAAIAGWLTTSIVTIRNSVKQHTINTLLQSRLSATYMEHVKEVNRSLAAPGGKIYQLTAEEVINPPELVNMQSIGYILNYLEFVSVGVRHFDLDERVMKSSLRHILCSNYLAASVLIDVRRKEQKNTKKPTLYENLVWLNKRWDNPELRSEIAVRPLPEPTRPRRSY